MTIDLDEATRIVDLYRYKYSAIKDLWKQADRALQAMSEGLEFDCTEKALPWAIDPSARGALDLVPIEALREHAVDVPSDPSGLTS